MPEVTYRTKELLSIIKKIKKKQLEKQYNYQSLKDKLGLRVICTFESELEIVDDLIKSNFNVKNIEYKKIDLDFDKLNYQSNHYDVSFHEGNTIFDTIKNCNDYIFEIQVRTQNQHAWSIAAHKLSYKNDKGLPNELKRKLYRLLALYELSDQEIETINSFLKKESLDFEHKLLSKIEGKIYKYAKVDFDRDESIRNLKIISQFLPPEVLNKVDGEIENFITDNHEKIKIILDMQQKYARLVKSYAAIP